MSSPTIDFDSKKLLNDHQILWKKYFEAKDEIARLLERELERDKRDIERAELIAEAMSKAKTKSDFIKILTM
jgi:predicted nucleic-acid-binding protein